MPTTSRPDVLPFALPDTIGLPYHGLVDAGVLTLPNSHTVDYEDPGGGQTIIVRHPRAAVPTRTATEAAADAIAGYQWRDYALLSGITRHIAGQALGQYSWLYCDANYTWVMSLVWTKVTSIQQRITITLVKAFGILKDSGVVMTPRVLATYTWTPLLENGMNQTTANGALGRVLGLTHSETGSVSVLNVAAYGTGNPWHAVMGNSYSLVTCGFHDALKIAVSGNGSIAAGTVGDGISVVISHIATAPDIYSTTGVVYSDFLCPSIHQCPQTATTETSQEFFHVAMPDGSVSAIAYQYSNTYTYSYWAADCDIPVCGNYDYERLASWTLTFGPHSLSGSIVETGYWDGTTHVTSYTSDGIPYCYRVHDNVIWIGLNGPGTKTIYTLSGQALDVTSGTEGPGLTNTTVEPEQGIIRYTDGAFSGCYV